METETHNILVIICSVLIVFLVVGLLIFLAMGEVKNHENICKKIAIASNMQFLDHSRGRCGSGILCSYQCKLLNSNGDIVIKNVP